MGTSQGFRISQEPMSPNVILTLYGPCVLVHLLLDVGVAFECRIFTKYFIAKYLHKNIIQNAVFNGYI